MWCGPCYLPLDNNEFPISRRTNEDGDVYEEENSRYKVVRNGDNLVTPFQCDTCHFRNLLGRDPIENYAEDIRLAKLIRRANLDALWSTEPGTIERTLAEAKRGLAIAAALGFQSQLFQPMGPFPIEDSMGMGAAIVTLQLSLNTGKYAKNVQFGTICKFCSAYSNMYHASARSQESMVMAKDTKKLTVTKCTTFGLWFEKFMRGCHKKMGEIVCPDTALSIEILLEMFKLLEHDWLQGTVERFAIAMEGAYYAIAYCCALRGEELPLVDLAGIRKHWSTSTTSSTPHVTVALLGRFKGETGENYHLMPIVPRTRSGIDNQKWVG